MEWEDCGMDREYGAAEAARFVKEKMGFKSAGRLFDSAFAEARPNRDDRAPPIRRVRKAEDLRSCGAILADLMRRLALQRNAEPSRVIPRLGDIPMYRLK